MVSASNIIKSSISPIELLLEDYSESTISLLDLIGIFEKVLNLKSKLKEVKVKEGGDPNLIETFIVEVMVYLCKNTYQITQEELENKYAVETFKKISKEYLKADDFFAKNIFDGSVNQNENITLEKVVNMFKDIEKNKSDEKNLERQMLFFLYQDTSNKYDDLIITLNNVAYPMYMFKATFLQSIGQVDYIFPSEAMDDTFTKLSYMLINGFFDESDISYGSDDKVKDVIAKNFQECYTNGQSVFLLKLVIGILDNYDYVYQSGNTELIQAFNDVFTNNEYSLSQKTSRTNRVRWNSISSISVQEILENTFFVATNDELLKLMDGVTTYQEFEQRNDQLENQYGYSSEQVLLEVTLNSSAAEMMPKIIALNKKIVARYEQFVASRPDIVKTVLKEVNSSVVLTHLVTIFNYPFEKSIGPYLVNAFRNVTETMSSQAKTNLQTKSNKLQETKTNVDNIIANGEQNYDSSIDKNQSFVDGVSAVYDANHLYSLKEETETTTQEASFYYTTYNNSATQEDSEITTAKTLTSDLTNNNISTKISEANQVREKIVNKN